MFFIVQRDTMLQYTHQAHEFWGKTFSVNRLNRFIRVAKIIEFTLKIFYGIFDLVRTVSYLVNHPTFQNTHALYEYLSGYGHEQAKPYFSDKIKQRTYLSKLLMQAGLNEMGAANAAHGVPIRFEMGRWFA